MGQHYVSQHYLKQFRIGTTPTVAIAQVDPFRWIGPGGIKGQCQEVDFYGKDSAIDRAYTQIEAGVAPHLVKVAVSLTWSDEEQQSLRMLAVALHLRTRKAIEAHKVFPRLVADEVLKTAIEKGELPPPPGGWRPGLIDFKGVPEELMLNTVSCYLEAASLRLKLLLAPKGESFITSDHPAVALNQFAAEQKGPRAFVGFSKSGFQLILPLSPNVAAMFYDPAVYRVGSRGARTVVVTVADVETLNALQVQSAEECIYSHDPEMAHYVEGLCRRFGALRTTAEDAVKRYPTNEPKTELIHLQKPPIRIPRPFSFVSRIKHVKAKPGDRRCPVTTEIIGKLMDDIKRNPDGGDIESRLDRIYAAV